MKRRELFIVKAEGPDGERVETLVARGDDGSFWMEPDYLELRPAEMEVLRRKEPGCVQIEPRHRKLLVDVRTAMRLLSPEERRIELYLLASEYLGIVEAVKPSLWD